MISTGRIVNPMLPILKEAGGTFTRDWDEGQNNHYFSPADLSEEARKVQHGVGGEFFQFCHMVGSGI